MTRFTTTILAAATLFASSCSKSPEQLLVGKWKSETKTLEFYKDGTLLLGQSRGNVDGKWSIPEAGTLRITLKPNGEAEFTETADFTVTAEEFSYKTKNSPQPSPNIMKRAQ